LANTRSKTQSAQGTKRSKPVQIISDPVEAAEAARLTYITDDELTIQRKRSGKGFTYASANGKAIHDAATLERIKKLGIPPAWTDVRISPLANGHIQAVGRDAKGRKQYRYHARWRERRSENNFNRMVAFGEALPKIRERVAHDLALPELPREKVLALVVRLLESTFIRIGNPEYARANRSYGLTTMHDRHVKISGSTVQFEFRGKSGKDHAVSVADRRLARLVKRCKDIPGYELFQYLDDQGQRHSINSSDVNAYVREITGQDFTAKDFRTWGGTVLAILSFQELGFCDEETQAKKNVTQVIKQVAEKLGNTPTICRKYYLHPAMIAAYMDNSLFQALERQNGKKMNVPEFGLNGEEQVTMEILRQHAAGANVK
jgi:DNA topoisomerase-1